jgi:SPP1 family predicted phage head-tail adaptor
MKSGRLDKRINIEVKSEVIGASGFRSLSWTVHKACWASFVHKTGGENTDDKNRTTSRIVEFKTRWFSTVTNQMRVYYNGDYYKIEDIKEIQRQQGMILMCSKLQQT